MINVKHLAEKKNRYLHILFVLSNYFQFTINSRQVVVGIETYLILNSMNVIIFIERYNITTRFSVQIKGLHSGIFNRITTTTKTKKKIQKSLLPYNFRYFPIIRKNTMKKKKNVSPPCANQIQNAFRQDATLGESEKYFWQKSCLQTKNKNKKAHNQCLKKNFSK